MPNPDQRAAERARRARIHWHVAIGDTTTCHTGASAAATAIRVYAADRDRDAIYARSLDSVDLWSYEHDHGSWSHYVGDTLVVAAPAEDCPHA